MTGHYQYAIARQRIADLHREAERERLAAAVAPPPTGTPRLNLFARRFFQPRASRRAEQRPGCHGHSNPRPAGDP
jgi:hypothetical protein